MYSLADQNNIDDQYFGAGASRVSVEKRFEMVKETVGKLRSENGLISIVDIVLNHVANNSHWIEDHPEACFSTDLIPRLWPAWLVDEAFMKMSDEFAKGKVAWCRSAPYINNESDLNQVIDEMRRRVFALNLHEYFVVKPVHRQDIDEALGLPFSTLEKYLGRFQ